LKQSRNLQHTRLHGSYDLDDGLSITRQVFAWAKGYEKIFFLHSNDYKDDPYKKFDALIGVSSPGHSQNPAFHSDIHSHTLQEIDTFTRHSNDWIFGHISYDLKNLLEKKLSSKHENLTGFPLLAFHIPEIVITLKDGLLEIHSLSTQPDEIFEAITNTSTLPDEHTDSVLALNARTSKETYLRTVEKLRDHIIAGDLYEINYCQEFYAEKSHINPFAVYERLNDLARSPFSAFVKDNEQYLLCASPERFIQKTGSQLISQPIKGTIACSDDPARNKELQKMLLDDPKSRAENVMIVDLVRNDLAKVCESGSITVKELFGVYKFKTVNHLISTVSGKLKERTGLSDILHACFPMGSMTGAPKIMTMQLIEQYEDAYRGLYSGAVGYIDPKGDFDFNVVIRSILSNEDNGYLSVKVGGAIVYDSDPQSEYDECILKAKALLQALSANITE